MPNTSPDKNSTYEERWNWLEQQLDSTTINALYRVAYRILQNPQDAQDVLQESFIRGALNCWQLKDDSSFFAWMYTIVRREANHYKAKPSLRMLVEALREQTGRLYSATNPEKLIVNAELHQQLAREVERLKSPEREIVHLKATTDMNLLQIAQRLGLNYHTTRSKYTRTLKLLQKRLLEDKRHEES
ncbi:MAG: sigma-70 family RNA polymerase sigma factor [Christensenellaceae bacterium]|nr:sigma-70 family RNA polymerase sigma factor [Christensenellaceae bacterium]